MYRFDTSSSLVTSFFTWIAPWRVAYLTLLILASQPQSASAEFFQFATTNTILNGFSPPTSVVTNNSTQAATLTTPLGSQLTLVGEASSTPGSNIDASGAGVDIIYAQIARIGTESVVVPYTSHLVIYDYPAIGSVLPDASSTFDLPGTLSGSLANLADAYSPYISTKFIGDTFYTVTLYPYTGDGMLRAHIQGGAVPEPGTFVLFGLGVLSLCALAVRRGGRFARSAAFWRGTRGARKGVRNQKVRFGS